MPNTPKVNIYNILFILNVKLNFFFIEVELKRGIKVSAAEANSPKRKDAHEDSLATMMTTPIGATFLGEVYYFLSLSSNL